MRNLLLGGASVLFAGIAATVGLAADHKPAHNSPAPMHASVITPAKATLHKATPKRHSPSKKHGRSRRHHHHHAK